MDLIRDIAAVIGLIAAILGLVTTVSQKGREAVKRFFSRNTCDFQTAIERQNECLEELSKKLDAIQHDQEDLETLQKTFEKANSIQLRAVIVDGYYDHVKTRQVPIYKRKVIDQVYTIYHDYYKENSFTTSLYNEIIKWEIV